MRRGGDDDDGDGDGVGQRWMGLAGRRTTADGEAVRGGGGRGGGAGEGLIAREIREQREREQQLLMQRRRAFHADVTSPQCRDDVSVTSSSLGDSETEIQRDSDVTVLAQLSRIARDPTPAGERQEESQKVFEAVVC